MTFKIYLKPDIERLSRLVEESRGNVLLRLADKSLHNLKNDESAAALLQREADNCNGVELKLLDIKDYPRFVSFMMGGCV